MKFLCNFEFDRKFKLVDHIFKKFNLVDEVNRLQDVLWDRSFLDFVEKNGLVLGSLKFLEIDIIVNFPFSPTIDQLLCSLNCLFICMVNFEDVPQTFLKHILELYIKIWAPALFFSPINRSLDQIISNVHKLNKLVIVCRCHYLLFPCVNNHSHSFRIKWNLAQTYRRFNDAVFCLVQVEQLVNNFFFQTHQFIFNII